MKSSLGAVAASTAAGIGGLIAALSLAGCLENPGPDAKLGQEKIKRSSASLYFEGEEKLSLQLREDGDSIHLEISNPDNETIDSADFLLQLGFQGNSDQPFLQTRPNLEYHGRVRDLRPGMKMDLGGIDPTLSTPISNLIAIATLLRISQKGHVQGDARGGMYTGTYSSRFRPFFPDSADLANGKVISGTSMGIVDAAGRFFFFLDPPDVEANDYFYSPYVSGSFSGDSLAAGFIHTHDFDALGSQLTHSRYSEEGGGMGLSFVFGDSTGWRDSLSLAIQSAPFPNRP
jgi:hypothetical protein